MNKELGNYIKEKREKLNISQRELARRINIDNGTIAKIEKGLVRKPSFETLIKLNDKLNSNDIEEFDKLLKLAKYTNKELFDIGYIQKYIGIAGSLYVDKYKFKYNDRNIIDIVSALKDYRNKHLNESEILGILSMCTGIDFRKYIPNEIIEKNNIYFIEEDKH